jgi:putative PIN family toxin of toxin-antitoxin system
VTSLAVLTPAIIDTNVLVAGLLTAEPKAPTARILDGMLQGDFPFVLSVDLLAEYRTVLLRERISKHLGLTADQFDAILTAVAANAIVREPRSSEEPAPEPGDQHLCDLLAAVASAVLVTGDKRLLENPPASREILGPGQFLDCWSD